MFIKMILFYLIVDLSSWEKKIQSDALAMGREGEWSDDGVETVLMEHHTDVAMELNSPTRELYKDGVLTLGCIGKIVPKYPGLSDVIRHKSWGKKDAYVINM